MKGKDIALKYVNFGGPEWASMKAYLQDQRDTRVKQLIAEESHDKSNRLRGQIEAIDLFLRLELTADNARRQP